MVELMRPRHYRDHGGRTLDFPDSYEDEKNLPMGEEGTPHYEETLHKPTSVSVSTIKIVVPLLMTTWTLPSTILCITMRTSNPVIEVIFANFVAITRKNESKPARVHQ